MLGYIFGRNDPVSYMRGFRSLCVVSFASKGQTCLAMSSTTADIRLRSTFASKVSERIVSN